MRRSPITARTSRSTLLFAGLGLVGSLVGCKEGQQERILRMDVELGKVNARSFALPMGTPVDFPQVAKDLFYRQVMNHDHFNVVTAPTAKKGFVASNDYQTEDASLLGKYGMLTALAPSSVASLAASPSAAIPQCLYERPLARLGSDILSFAATFSGNIKVGYDSLGGIAVGMPVGTTIEFNSAKMDLTLHWDDNFTKQPVAAAEGVSYSTDSKFSLALGSFPVGVDFFYKTPLADVVKSAFSTGLDQAVSAYIIKAAGNGKTWSDAWESRVISDPSIDNSSYVAFRAGIYANVMKGDKFTVQNQVYRWTDESNPCGSALKYSLPDGDQIAELEVVESSNLITVAKVKMIASGTIRPGAKVKILSLAVPVQPGAPSTAAANAAQLQAAR